MGSAAFAVLPVAAAGVTTAVTANPAAAIARNHPCRAMSPPSLELLGPGVHPSARYRQKSRPPSSSWDKHVNVRASRSLGGHDVVGAGPARQPRRGRLCLKSAILSAERAPVADDEVADVPGVLDPVQRDRPLDAPTPGEPGGPARA